VTWIIFKEPLEISSDQLKKCHELYEVRFVIILINLFVEKF
jgi:hypothetical protein